MKDVFAVYSRKSKFTGKGESIDNQIEMCREYIRKSYGDIAVKNMLIYEDEGFSGKNINRPEFKKMMLAASQKRFNTIICYRLDRISRNIGDFAKLIEELNKLEISFISVKEQFDTSSPMGRAMMYIASVFSQLERETIAERIRDNMHELAKTGRWLGGTTPTGYASEEVRRAISDGKFVKYNKLRLILEEAELVTLIFHKYIQTGSLTKTEAFLLQNKYLSKNGRNFTRHSIRNILSNPVYMVADDRAYNYFIKNGANIYSDKSEFSGEYGIMAYNRTEQNTRYNMPSLNNENQFNKAENYTEQCKEASSNIKLRAKKISDWIVCVGMHEAIISSADWIRVQDMLSQNKAGQYRKPKSNISLLSGLIICGGCGSHMRPKTYHRLNPDGTKRFYYLCSLKERSKGSNCSMNNPDGNETDNTVCNILNEIDYDVKVCKDLLSKAYGSLLKEDTDEELLQLKRLLHNYNNEITVLVKSLVKAKDCAAEEYILKQIDYTHKKIKRFEDNIVELENKPIDTNENELDVLVEAEAILQHDLRSLSPLQKNEAIRHIISKIVWDGDKLHIYFIG